jgi:hypothetical protein
VVETLRMCGKLQLSLKSEGEVVSTPLAGAFGTYNCDFARGSVWV